MDKKRSAFAAPDAGRMTDAELSKRLGGLQRRSAAWLLVGLAGAVSGTVCFFAVQWLTSSTAYGNSQRGENYYLYTISWQGSSYLIEFAYSTEWEYNVSDWAQVLTKSYVVYIPEDYNGLIFAAEAQPLTYKESAKRMQLDSICPEAAIMDIDTLDPYSCLFFDLCD